uniref:RNA-directed DNA polymerase, eukaryota n=1 Tax=Tanacetum cinerariifolium TaxID=118510 RepID=A0A6L2MNR4_TANCI|nr:RNA-directed DNA polymerase, eukaryota [Tanacetum cinerariifolium]
MAWKVRFGFLSTRLNLSRRCLDLQSILCVNCNKEVESTSHVFFACSMARDLYRNIASWWDISYSEFSSYEEWLEWLLNLRIQSDRRKILEDVLCKEINHCHLALHQEQSHRQDVLHENSEACRLTILQEPTDRLGQLAVYLGNPCHSCSLEHVKLNCTGFTSRMEIDPEILSRQGDLCIVNNDQPVPRLSFISFSNDCRDYFPFALASETVTCS